MKSTELSFFEKLFQPDQPCLYPQVRLHPSPFPTPEVNLATSSVFVRLEQRALKQMQWNFEPLLVPRLPYTEATLLEIQRLGVVAPFPPPHIALQDTKIAGYDVPKVSSFRYVLSDNQIWYLFFFIYIWIKGTFVFVNLWGVLREEKLWSEPLRFRPERHLDENGRVVKSEHLIHFGLGSFLYSLFTSYRLNLNEI